MAASRPANPAIVVGLGTPDSCNEAAFRNALVIAQTERSGIIQFNCGGGPMTVVATLGPDATITLPNRTTIDGGGLVTLSVQSSYKPSLTIALKITVVVQNLALDAKVQNFGAFTVRNVTFSVHDGIGFSTLVNFGTATIQDSRFGDPAYRSSSYADPIDNEDVMAINGTTFSNLTNAGVGAITNAATLDVTNSVFCGNYADITGAIWNLAKTTITNCEFSNNGGLDSRAILSAGSLTVVNSTFSDNTSGAAGATIGGSGTTVVKRSQFLRNRAAFRGALSFSGGTLTIDKSIFSGNHASYYGGAIYTGGAAAVTISGSTITENTADIDGGGIYVDGATAPTLIKTTVTGNTPNNIVVIPSTPTVITTTVQ